MKGFKQSLAVVIGIENYSDGIRRLRTPRADATRLAKILKEQHDYEVRSLLDVTGNELLDLLTRELPSILTDDDRLLFYFAGHGIAIDGDDGPQGYLVPRDAKGNDPKTFLPMTAVYDALDDLNCRHMLIVLDCCFAGAFRWASSRNLAPVPAVIYKERYDRYIRDPA